MSLYSNLATTAARLLAQFGQDVTLQPSAQATYNPATSVATSTAGTSVSRKGAIFDFGKGVTNVRGNLVQATDRQLLLEPGVAPKLSDAVVVGGATFAIVSVGELSPGGVPVLYDLHLRR